MIYVLLSNTNGTLTIKLRKILIFKSGGGNVRDFGCSLYQLLSGQISTGTFVIAYFFLKSNIHNCCTVYIGPGMHVHDTNAIQYTKFHFPQYRLGSLWGCSKPKKIYWNSYWNSTRLLSLRSAYKRTLNS